MRINKFIAFATGLSRRAVDRAIQEGKVHINDGLAETGQEVTTYDKVELVGKRLSLPTATSTIALNKPIGYVVSRAGQGSNTIYDLLPSELNDLKPIGRLDKDSSGLLLLTNDGHLANRLTHPKFQKSKVYHIQLNQPLAERDKQKIEQGIMLKDGLSSLHLNGEGTKWTITMQEGRNRQIRRTFLNLGYNVLQLHRIQFGHYQLGQLECGSYIAVSTDDIL